MESEGVGAPSPEVVNRLVAGHRDFLSFLESRLPSREVAEEILQSAFARTLEKGGAIRESESAVAWFYRLLRNALTDYYRRRAAEARALERRAREPGLGTEIDGEIEIEETELRGAICACMSTLLPNLKSEYAGVLQKVDLDERPIGQVAEELGITSNNATVRLHRARKALRRELERSCGTCAAHGCLDCSCRR